LRLDFEFRVNAGEARIHTRPYEGKTVQCYGGGLDSGQLPQAINHQVREEQPG
jgi:hypothetical protein